MRRAATGIRLPEFTTFDIEEDVVREILVAALEEKLNVPIISLAFNEDGVRVAVPCQVPKKVASAVPAIEPFDFGKEAIEEIPKS